MNLSNNKIPTLPSLISKAVALALCFLLFGGNALADRPNQMHNSSNLKYLPNFDFTPGRLDLANVDRICSSRRESKASRNISSAMKNRIFRSYKISPAKRSAYKIDFLIPVEIGGAKSQRNLWPQSNFGAWGHSAKDRVESVLKQEVCAGKITLDEAQTDIAQNWIEEYKEILGAEVGDVSRKKRS